MRSRIVALALAAGCILSVAHEVQPQPLPPGPGAPARPGSPAGPAGPGAPGPGGHTFELQMCNKASPQVGDILLAIAGATRRSDGETLIRVEGWWKIPAAQCVNLGEHQRPGVFVHAMAQGGRASWADPEPALCVNLKAAFEYVFNPDADRPCAQAEERKGFFPVKIDSKDRSITFNLTSG